MKKNAATMIAMMIFISTLAIAASTQPPQTGSSLPEIKMIKPVEAGDLKYLGISGSGTFMADEVKGQALILQIFSLYCPYCQKDAPNVNRFFGLIENNPKLKGKIKILGIGAGNSQFVVNTF